jgi:hypothetical protein
MDLHNAEAEVQLVLDQGILLTETQYKNLLLEKVYNASWFNYNNPGILNIFCEKKKKKKIDGNKGGALCFDNKTFVYYSGQVPEGIDSYELDDCALASTILDNIPQQHTFHTKQDEDWFVMCLQQGNFY